MFHVLLDQCITIRQWKVRYPFVYFFSPYFTLFTLCFFHVALSSCYTLFFCCSFVRLHYFHVAFVSMLSFSVLHSSHVAVFSCWTIFVCTFFGLHFFRVTLFSSCTLFMLQLSACCAFFMMHFFRAALILCCCLFFMLHSFHVTPFCV